MKEKKYYEDPTLELVRFEAADIITASEDNDEINTGDKPEARDEI